MNDTDITLNSLPPTVYIDSSEAVYTESDEDELLKACSDEDRYSDSLIDEYMLLEEGSDLKIAPNLVFDTKPQDENQPSGSTIQGKKTQNMDDTDSPNSVFDEKTEDVNQPSGSAIQGKKIKTMNDTDGDTGSDEYRLIKESSDRKIAENLFFNEMSEHKNQASGLTKKRKKTQNKDDTKSPHLVFGEKAGEKHQPSASPQKRQKPLIMDYTCSYSERNVNVLLIGKAGSGKSTTGNSILRSTPFKASPAAHLVTRDCQEEKGKINNVPVTVVDTPGLFSLEMNNSIVQAKIGEFLKNRPHMWPLVIVLCIQAVRFTKEDKSVLHFFKENFGSHVYDNMVVVSTDGMLDTEHKMPKWFKLFLKKIDNRTFCFNSDSPDIDHQLTLFITKCQMMLNRPENLNYKLSDYDTAQLRIKEKKRFRRSQNFRSIQNRTNDSPIYDWG